MIKKMAVRERMFWLSIGILIVFSGYCSQVRKFDPVEQDKYLALWNEAYQTVKTKYVDREKMNAKKLYFGALKGMFAALDDPHSNFLDDKVKKLLEEQLRGAFAGIGFSLLQDGKDFVITGIIPKSPAQKADLRSGDRIVKINGRFINKYSFQKVIYKLRGRPNTKVRITIMRGNTAITKTIVRAIIKMEIVEQRLLKKDIGYIRLRQFSTNSAGAVKRSLDKLKNNDIKGLIFDLRGNPGGGLSVCEIIINFFLKGGLEIVRIERADGHVEVHYSHNAYSFYPNIPLVVLAGSNSASASEIFVGAIQDHKRGIVIGEKTYGKGTVQIFNEANTLNEVAFKLTNSKWLTALGRKIDKKGLQPDIKIINPPLTLDEKFYIKKLKKNRLLINFVQKHPSLSNKDINKIMRNLNQKKYKLRRSLVIKLLKYEKKLRSYGLIIDLQNDKALKAAWQHLTKDRL